MRYCILGHIKGIIPIDETEFENGAQLRDAVSRTIYYKVLQLDRNSAIFGASSKQAIDHLQGLTWDRLRENMVIEAKITRVNNRSLHLDVGAIKTYLQADEVSYEWIDNIHDRYKTLRLRARVH
ncbi:hypothetical protein ABEW19_10890 [Paenibacillus illinoisensis]|uniref:hypothetical protein n=1 Tax=Paenibacillus illinoisensis TaxID=59845 RepID=UPI003D279E63